MKTTIMGHEKTSLLQTLLLGILSGSFLVGCSVGIHEEVYPLANAKARVVTSAVITPNAEGEYGFTVENIPTATIYCVIDGAKVFYSFDGAPYAQYTGPLTLPIVDRKVDQTIILSAYSAHPDYEPSVPVSQTYRFVATTVPEPTFSESADVTATGTAGEYTFTAAGVPTISLLTALEGSTAHYSLDGAPYQAYSSPITLSIADYKVGQTFTVSAYAEHPNYRSSVTVTRTYRFVPTSVPEPAFSENPGVTATATEGEYSFTVTGVPTISLSTALPVATTYYSIDGAPYQAYSGPITLAVADYKAGQTFTVRAYAAHPNYIPSGTVTRTYRFVPTRVPTPTIDAAVAPYYRYDAPPTVTVNCALAGATVWYSTNGGATYTQATGPFALPVPGSAEWNVNLDRTLTVYATSPNYIDSLPETRTFVFYGEGRIATIAGTGIAGDTVEGEEAWTQPIEKPIAIYVDDEKNVYFSTVSCVWKIAAGTNEIRRLAGLPGETGVVNVPVDARTTACLANPLGLAGDDATDQLYISSSGVHQILRVPYGGGQIARVLGKPTGTAYMPGDSTTAPDAGIIYPTDILISDGKLYFSETGRHVVRTVNALGELTTVAGTPAEYGSDINHLYQPLGLCLVEGTMYIADSQNDYIRTVVPPNPNLANFKSVIENPVQIRFDGSYLYYMYQESGHNLIVRYEGPTSTPVAGSIAPTEDAEGSLATNVALLSVSGFFIVPHDGIYIADWSAYRVRKVILY